jgi:hypothetical protein
LEVNVVSHRGTESGGNDTIPVTTLHPAEQVSVAAELCPAVSVCDDDKYQNTVPLAVAPLSVNVVGAVIVNAAVPMRIWHGVELLQRAPSVCTAADVSVAMKSPSCDAIPAPPPPPVPASRLHTLVDVHPYRFWPAGALESKNICPVEHTAGMAEPTCAGFVEDDAEKSTSLDCVARRVWALANPIAAIKNTAVAPIPRLLFIVIILFSLLEHRNIKPIACF